MIAIQTEKKQDTPEARADALDARVLAKLAVEASALNRSLEETREGLGLDNGLSDLRHRILRNLEEGSPLEVDRLPARWPLTREHVRGTVATLVDDGHLEPFPGSERGRPRVRITPAGRMALRRMDQEAWSTPALLVDGVTSKELDEAVRVLRKVRTSLEE